MGKSHTTIDIKYTVDEKLGARARKAKLEEFEKGMEEFFKKKLNSRKERLFQVPIGEIKITRLPRENRLVMTSETEPTILGTILRLVYPAYFGK